MTNADFDNDEDFDDDDDMMMMKVGGCPLAVGAWEARDSLLTHLFLTIINIVTIIIIIIVIIIFPSPSQILYQRYDLNSWHHPNDLQCYGAQNI